MRRLFYLAIGVGIGVAAVRKATRAARRLTPSGVAGSARSSAAGLCDSARAFIDDVRVSMTEREIQLHEALQGDDPGRGR